MLTTNETVQAIRSEKENLLKIIEQDQPPVAPPATLSTDIEQTIGDHHADDEQLVDDQVQFKTDLATPTRAKHFE
ncbi:hypothetical protein FXO38_16203 [Capsicum annuum]|nr:hypothetical protein FXO38_16203 [Capsicum annuum]